MVRYKKRYALVFIDPPFKISTERLQQIFREHIITLFGITFSEMAQSLQIMYYHPYTGTLIIRTRLMFIDYLRVALLYFNRAGDNRFDAIVEHVSATMKQLSKIFEGKIRQYILYNAHKCDPVKLTAALAEVLSSMEQLKINS